MSATAHTDKSIVVIEASFNPNGLNAPELKEYSRRSNANGEAHGGVVLSEFQVTENLGQGDTPQMIVLVEYPNLQKAKETFTSDEYQSILPLRDVVFREVKILFTKHS